MKISHLLLAIGVFATSALGFGTPLAGQAATAAPRVEIVTELGTIVAELYPDKAPISVANFLRYVDAKHYDGGQFQRTVRMDNQPNDSVKIEVIQGSVAAANNAQRFPARVQIDRADAEEVAGRPPV